MNVVTDVSAAFTSVSLRRGLECTWVAWGIMLPSTRKGVGSETGLEGRQYRCVNKQVTTEAVGT